MLFVIAKDRTQSKYPSTVDRLNDLCYIPTTGKHVAMRKDTFYVQAPRHMVKSKRQKKINKKQDVLHAIFVSDRQKIINIFILVCVCRKQLWENRKRID